MSYECDRPPRQWCNATLMVADQMVHCVREGHYDPRHEGFYDDPTPTTFGIKIWWEDVLKDT